MIGFAQAVNFTLFSVAAFAIMGLPVEHTAKAGRCNTLPDVEWWVNSPDKIKKLVKTRYKGDWDFYIAAWHRYHDSMETSLEIGKERLIKSRGITLSGPNLAVYVHNIKKRIEVLNCLSAGGKLQEDFSTFSTEAGGDPAQPPTDKRLDHTLLVTTRCEALPQVDWWSKSPAAVKNMVIKKYNGDWGKYIERWKTHYRSMKQSSDNDKPRVVKSRGLTLRGKILERHVTKIEKRIEVLKCMQKNAEIVEARRANISGPTSPTAVKLNGASAAIPKSVSDVANFETASGGSSIAMVSGPQLDLEVAANCSGEQVKFRLTNIGDKWPRTGEVNIYRTDTKALLMKRRIRMRNLQRMSIVLPPSRLKGAGEVAIFVKPGWFDRNFKYDLTANCDQ